MQEVDFCLTVEGLEMFQGEEVEQERHEWTDATASACLANLRPDRRNLESALSVVLCSTFRVDGLDGL